MSQATEILKEYFGYPSFRGGQETIIEALMGGRDVLGVMPTGAGKSLCYQIPALMHPGTALVISPLISLMKDQVGALIQAGVPAAYLNSTLSAAQQREVLTRAAAGRYRLLYVAPERLTTPAFLDFTNSADLSLVAVDEAHCISQWGQDFRPGYLKIAEFLDALPKRPAVCAYTATATHTVREDIMRLLRLREPFVLVSGFDRPNLYFSVAHPKDKNAALLALLEKRRGQSGIVYCSTRKAVDEVYTLLSDSGYAAGRYHAGLEAEDRHACQEDFLYDRRTVMVATNAFGMGIDKSNVSFVIHYNMPQNIESYYQEAGRAGRDGAPADCILLYAAKDVRTCQFLLERGRTEDDELTQESRAELLHRDLERLRQMTFYSTTTDCLRGFLLRYFGETVPPRCEHCSNCHAEFETEEVTVEAQKIVSCVYRLGQRRRAVGKATLAEILHGSKGEKILRSGYDSLSTYGIMADAPVRRIRYLLDKLIEADYLECTADEYPVVRATTRSDEIVRDRVPFSVQIPKALPKKEAPPRREKEPLAESDVGLFDTLRTLRAKLAAQAKIPAYIVFSDATLRDMCRRLPRDDGELLEVSGVGAVKAQRYGEAFLGCIQTYLDGN